MRVQHDFAASAGAIGPSLHNRRAWDALRDSGLPGFAIPEDRQEWLASISDRLDLKERAQAIVQICRALGLSRVFSVGAGSGALEFYMKAVDQGLHLTCADYAPGATARLRNVFSECDEVIVFDMLHDKWKPANGTLYLLHRVDTELSNQDWRRCFSAMGSAGVSPVLFVVSEFLTPQKRIRA